MEAGAALVDGEDDVLDADGVLAHEVDVVVVLAHLRVISARKRHPERDGVQPRRHLLQEERVAVVLESVALAAARAVETETEQRAPVEAVDAQTPGVAVEQVGEDGGGGPVAAEVDAAHAVAGVGEGGDARLEERAEVAGPVRAVVVVEVGEIGEAGPVDVEQHAHAARVDGGDELGEVLQGAEGGVGDPGVDDGGTVWRGERGATYTSRRGGWRSRPRRWTARGRGGG